MVNGLHLNYPACNIVVSEETCDRGLGCKFTHGLYSVNKELLEMDSKQVGTRGHMFKLAKMRCRISMRQTFFSFRVVDKWANLPAAVVEAPSSDSFKNRLDTHWATLEYCV
jgi:hypothetical protein